MKNYKTQNFPIRSMFEKGRALELNNLREKLTKEGWEFVEYFEGGTSMTVKSHAIFRIDIDTDRGKQSSTENFWGLARKFFKYCIVLCTVVFLFSLAFTLVFNFFSELIK